MNADVTLEALTCDECGSNIVRNKDGLYECSKPGCAKLYTLVEK